MPNDTFVKYAKYYDLCNKNKPYKEEIEFIYKWANKPKKILDLGCGTASYWKYYPKGIYIVGVDKSIPMLSLSIHSNKSLCCDFTKKLPSIGIFDTATALFDVLNYVPNQTWWKKLPIKKGGYFVFDIWDKDKVIHDGFKTTQRGNRIIEAHRLGNKVTLKIILPDCEETHKMYLYSDRDIIKFCGKEYEITDKKETDTWQTWYRLKRL